MAYHQAHDSNTQKQNSYRVYINPNFQKNNTPVIQSGSMYINPLFSQQQSHLQATNLNKPKIYVNPNFVKTCSNVSGHLNKPNNQVVVSTSTVSPQPSTSAVNTKTTSRYSIVRHNIIQPKEAQSVPNHVTTIKINKYKSVSMEHVKKNLETVKSFNTQTSTLIQSLPPKSTPEIGKKHIKNEFLQSRFKLIKKNTEKHLTKSVTTKTVMNKRLSLKSIPRVSQKLKICQFKKNNIPCPQFRKYGKCMRNIQGKCDLLHDKKHVTICRKFLNGSCHDKNCLLSHQVSAKKMPTCSFYLKGMCTKEDCPYLHVKLNERTKICVDFLKGYCEKADKCLNRHINICPDLASKGICIRKRCPYPHKRNRKSTIKKNKNNTKTLNESVKSDKQKRMNKSIEEESSKSNTNQTNKDSERRYYLKEITDEESVKQMETIKPTRCKLGDLPSFIEL